MLRTCTTGHFASCIAPRSKLFKKLGLLIYGQISVFHYKLSTGYDKISFQEETRLHVREIVLLVLN